MTADRWDTGLDDITFRFRADLHTRVRWTAPGPWVVDNGRNARASVFGRLDGPAALGPFRGWGIEARILPVTVIDPANQWWRLVVTLAPHDVIRGERSFGDGDRWSCMFGVGPVSEPPAFRACDGAKQAFEDVARGLRPDEYRVNGGETDRWWPLRQAPALIEAARRRREPKPGELAKHNEQGSLI